MTCDEIAAGARELASTRARDAEPPPRRAAARAHAAACAGCARRLEEARALDDRLAALARAEAEAEGPPAALEARLVAAFREKVAAKAAPTRPRRAARRGAAVGLAAAAAGALWLASPRSPPPLTGGPPAPHVPAPAAAPDERLTGFVPIGAPERTHGLEAAHIHPVRLSAQVAAYFGWPLAPEAGGDDPDVRAELLVGEDGVARALRFLPVGHVPRPSSPPVHPRRTR